MGKTMFLVYETDSHYCYDGRILCGVYSTKTAAANSVAKNAWEMYWWRTCAYMDDPPTKKKAKEIKDRIKEELERTGQTSNPNGEVGHYIEEVELNTWEEH